MLAGLLEREEHRTRRGRRRTDPQHGIVPLRESVSILHLSGDCFGCSRDTWEVSNIELAGGGSTILDTGPFKIGHETVNDSCTAA